MATNHIVEQGEHLSGIAEKYGFADYRTIWEHPENAQLKKERQNPNVLYPGDKLFIPEKELKEYSRQTENRHPFRLLAQPLMLRIRLERDYDQPLANTKCELSVELDLFKLTSDGNGEIKQKIAKDAVNARLVIKDSLIIKKKKVPFDIELPVKIGFLDPVDKRSGQLARLMNLGYYRGSVDEVDEQELLSAIEEFQCEHNLTVDGNCGPQTQARLKEVHGC